MNRSQMITALKSGYYITHSLFSNDEFIYMKDSIIYDENDYNMGGLSSEFMTIREGDGWENDWQIKEFDEPELSPFLENMIQFKRNDMYDMSDLLPHRTEKLKHSAHYTSIRKEPKIDRNSICPCGSGLKYKKCCINK